MTGPLDTGATLRALYEPEGGVRAVFSSKVADYVRSALTGMTLACTSSRFSPWGTR